MKPAPLFADAFRLYTWLHGHFVGSPDPLARAIVEPSTSIATSSRSRESSRRAATDPTAITSM